jgi:hypothetical protein
MSVAVRSGRIQHSGSELLPMPGLSGATGARRHSNADTPDVIAPGMLTGRCVLCVVVAMCCVCQVPDGSGGWTNAAGSTGNELPICPPSTCADGTQNGDETGVDCGGSCSACPTCADGTQNGNETGVDCGGSCSACPTCVCRSDESKCPTDSTWTYIWFSVVVVQFIVAAVVMFKDNILRLVGSTPEQEVKEKAFDDEYKVDFDNPLKQSDV